MTKGASRERWAWAGRWAYVVAGVLVLTGSVRAEDPQPQGSIERLSLIVNGELTDVAGSLRQLDQSYVYRGMQGCGSATAGSVYIDWDAKGVPQEQRVRVLPPQPLVLSKSMKKPCQQAQPEARTVEPQPQPVPATTPGCPCQSVPPATTTETPCPAASGPIVGQSIVIDPPLPSGHYEARSPVVVMESAPSSGCASGRCQLSPSAVNGGCGGKAPPHAMYVNGQWTEQPVRWGRESYPYVAPGVRVAPSMYSAPGYAPIW